MSDVRVAAGRRCGACCREGQAQGGARPEAQFRSIDAGGDRPEQREGLRAHVHGMDHGRGHDHRGNAKGLAAGAVTGAKGAKQP